MKLVDTKAPKCLHSLDLLSYRLGQYRYAGAHISDNQGSRPTEGPASLIESLLLTNLLQDVSDKAFKNLPQHQREYKALPVSP